MRVFFSGCGAYIKKKKVSTGVRGGRWQALFSSLLQLCKEAVLTAAQLALSVSVSNLDRHMKAVSGGIAQHMACKDTVVGQ